MSRFAAVIVGSGLNSLACRALLALAGRRGSVLEFYGRLLGTPDDPVAQAARRFRGRVRSA